MITVYTQEQFAKALENRESQIICEGKIKEEILKKEKIKKGLKIGSIALGVLGLLAIPFTLGASSGLTAVGAAGFTAGAVTMSTAEVAIICGSTVAITVSAMIKGINVKVGKDGVVVVTPDYK